MELQYTKEQFAEYDGMTRRFSPQDLAEVDQAFTKLVQQNNLVPVSDNVLMIFRTYNNNPAVKITVDEVVSMVTAERNRGAFKWLSKDEIESNRLQAELGQEQSDLLHRLLPRHGLVDNQTNFILLGQFHSKNRWPINANTFQRSIDSLRLEPQGYRLLWAPTPDEIRVRKEAEDARKQAEAAPKKTPLQVALAKASAVRGAKNPATGRDYADEIMEAYYDEHPLEEAPATTPKQTPVNSSEEYFAGRVRDFIRSIRSSITRARAEVEFGKSKYANWELTFAELQTWYSKQGVK